MTPPSDGDATAHRAAPAGSTLPRPTRPMYAQGMAMAVNAVRRGFVGFLAGLLLAGWAGLSGDASAQDRRRRRQPRVIQLDEIRIEGRVQKPNAFYILNRSNLGYEVMDLRTSFVREVVRSVRRDPF